LKIPTNGPKSNELTPNRFGVLNMTIVKSVVCHSPVIILLLENELIYIGVKKNLRKKVVTEASEISEILNQYHSNPMGGHSGINNTLAKISQYYLWSGMKDDVVEYVS